MNRVTVVFILTSLSFFPSSAQILIGPEIGPQVSWVSFEDKESRSPYRRKPVVGYHAGVGVSFRVHKRFFLNAAVLYSTKGKSLTGREDQIFRHQARYRYIDIPMAYTVEFLNKVGKSRQYKWYLGMGPNVSYWISGKGSLENAQLNENLIERLDYKVVFNKERGDFTDNQMSVADPNRLQLGLNLSAGFVFEPMGYQKILMNIRYEAGHSFYSRESTGLFNLTNEYEDNLRVRNQGFRLTFAYMIDLKTEERKKGKSTIKRNKMK
ncbi:MAG: porin family protein [Bacteroidota bacterium]